MRVPPYTNSLSIKSLRRYQKELYLDVGLRLVGNLHDVLGLALDHVLEDLLVDTAKGSTISGSPRGCGLIKRTRHPSCQSWRRRGTPCPRRGAGRAHPTGRARCTGHRGQGGTSFSCRRRRSWGTGGETPCRYVGSETG